MIVFESFVKIVCFRFLSRSLSILFSRLLSELLSRLLSRPLSKCLPTLSSLSKMHHLVHLLFQFLILFLHNHRDRYNSWVPRRSQWEVLGDEKHGAWDDSSVVAEEESTKAREDCENSEKNWAGVRSCDAATDEAILLLLLLLRIIIGVHSFDILFICNCISGWNNRLSGKENLFPFYSLNIWTELPVTWSKSICFRVSKISRGKLIKKL